MEILRGFQFKRNVVPRLLTIAEFKEIDPDHPMLLALIARVPRWAIVVCFVGCHNLLLAHYHPNFRCRF